MEKKYLVTGATSNQPDSVEYYLLGIFNTVGEAVGYIINNPKEEYVRRYIRLFDGTPLYIGRDAE